MGAILHGWALVESWRQLEEGIARIRKGLTDLRATGAGLWQPCFLALLAEACGKANRVEEGLAVLDEALAAVHERGERFYEAELHRLKGELLLQRDGAEEPEVEASFQMSTAVARAQQARSLELRAALSLARLWAGRGEQRKAHDLLAPVYEWFTEGFGTSDLQEAKALLAKLN
jgi:predicted ATPase